VAGMSLHGEDMEFERTRGICTFLYHHCSPSQVFVYNLDVIGGHFVRK